MKHKSKPSSVKNLRVFFKNMPDSDSITLQDAYVAFNRDLSAEQVNKNWITNLMTHLKWHNLIIPTYATGINGKRVLKGFELTMEGKRSLGRIETTKVDDIHHVLPTTIKQEIEISDIMKAIAKLKETHPEFEISFDMKLKGV